MKTTAAASGGPAKTSGATSPRTAWTSPSPSPTPSPTSQTAASSSKVAQPDGYTQWNWHVSYPINSYDVALNIAAYTHFTDTYTSKQFPPLPLDFYALPEDLDKARAQYAQAKGMLDAFEHYFGEYPFARDGYKLIQVPYAGMEHQSAVAYGNQFKNGYLQPRLDRRRHQPAFRLHHHPRERPRVVRQRRLRRRPQRHVDPRGLDHLPRNPLRRVPVRPRRRHQVHQRPHPQGPKNVYPVIEERGVNRDPRSEDQYFKGALMIATLRSWLAADGIADDARWFQLIHDFYQRFKYKNIMTEDVTAWWQTNVNLPRPPGRILDLNAFFDQYLHHAAIPCLELNFNPADGTVSYKWQAEAPGFAMPIQAGDPQHWQVLHPTQDWQTLKTPLTKDQFQVATDLFYINVSKT